MDLIKHSAPTLAWHGSQSHHCLTKPKLDTRLVICASPLLYQRPWFTNLLASKKKTLEHWVTFQMPLIFSLVQELLHSRNVIVLVSWICLYMLLKHWLQQQSSPESAFILQLPVFHNPCNFMVISIACTPYSTFLLPFIFPLMGLDKELSEQSVSLATSFCVLLFVRVSMIISWTTFKSTVCPAWLHNLLNQTNVANLSVIPQASNIEFIHNILIFSIHKWNVATKKIQ